MVYHYGDYINRTDKNGNQLHKGDSVRYTGSTGDRHGRTFYVVRKRGVESYPRVLLTELAPGHKDFHKEGDGFGFKSICENVQLHRLYTDRQQTTNQMEHRTPRKGESVHQSDQPAAPAAGSSGDDNNSSSSSSSSIINSNGPGSDADASAPPPDQGEELGPEYVYPTGERVRVGDEVSYKQFFATVVGGAGNSVVNVVRQDDSKSEFVHVNDLALVVQAGGQVRAHTVRVECTDEQLARLIDLLAAFGCDARVE